MILTEDNFMLVAMHHYDNNQLNTIEEFQTDLNKINCCRKLIERYMISKEINLRLLLNHCILLHNSFGSLICDMFTLKFDTDYLAVIKPVLTYLRVIKQDEWPDIEYDIKIHGMLDIL